MLNTTEAANRPVLKYGWILILTPKMKFHILNLYGGFLLSPDTALCRFANALLTALFFYPGFSSDGHHCRAFELT
jgi:hypothetical protein